MGDLYDSLNLEELRKVGTSHAYHTAGFILVFGVVFAVAAAMFGALMNTDAMGLAALAFGAFGFFAFAAGALLLWRNAGQVEGVIGMVLQVLDAEIKFRYPTQDLPELPAPTLPALPDTEAEESFTLNRNGVGEVVPKNMLHGFDPRDLEWLFDYLENGGKWTEDKMERYRLPYSRERIGKASEGTPYTRFMDLCVRAGIITGREPKKTGTLAIPIAADMLAAVKALPQE